MAAGHHLHLATRLGYGWLAVRAVLVIECPDRPGIVAATSTFLLQLGADITDLVLGHGTETTVVSARARLRRMRS